MISRFSTYKKSSITLMLAIAVNYLAAQSNILNVQNDQTGQTGNPLINVACKEVHLKAGYRYTSQPGKSMRSYVDPVMVCDPHIPVDITYISSTPPPLNTTYEVGSTAGSFAVTQTGGAVYTIPLMVPPGTAGMVPNLSISYSSQGGEGLLGIGWNLSGLSSISRIGKNPYHDVNITGVTLTVADRFALDGNRLIGSMGQYGLDQTVYGTEVENFSKITSYGSAGGGPAYFKVENKDGSILEYGNTADSRIEPSGISSGGVVLTWLLNKVTDSRGNYMTIHYYENNATGEFRPDHIKYTGNSPAGLNPYNMVYFGYDIRQDKQTAYVAGYPVRQNVLLKQVQMYVMADLVHSYNFDYSYNMNSHLSMVTEIGKDNKQFNPIRIGWNTNDINPVISELPNPIQTSVSPYMHTLDFNGDGFDDRLYVSDNDYRADINNKTGGFTFGPNLTYTTVGKPKYQAVRDQSTSGDFDGDGLDDMCILTQTNDPAPVDFRCTFLRSTGSGLVEDISNSFTKHYDINTDHNADFKAAYGDFDGDGATDLFVHFYDADRGFIHSFRNNTTIEVFSNDIGDVNLNFATTDFNGDGKQELLLYYTNPSGTCDGSNNSYSQLYEFNGSTLVNVSGCMTYPTGYHRIYPGDFNGDGKTDILTWSGGGWTIGYSTGNMHDFYEVPAGIANWGDPNIPSTYHTYTVQDFNGDGKADILDKSTPNGGAPTYFEIRYGTGSIGNPGGDFIIGYANYDRVFDNQGSDFIGDFNGDGRKEIWYYTGQGGAATYHQVALMPGMDVHKVSGIIDGLENIVTISYGTLPILATQNLYTKGTGATYPVNDLQKSMTVVFRTQNKSCFTEGQEGTMNYAYNGAKIHLQGKGFLGFSKVTTTDVYRQFASENTYKTDMTWLSANFFQPVLSLSKTTTSPPLPALPLPVSEKTFLHYNFINGTNLALIDGTGKRYYFYADQTQDNDQLHGNITTYTVAQNKYGNVTSENSSNSAVSISSTYTYEQKSAWIPSRLLTSQTITTRTGEPAYSRSVTFENNGIGGLASKKIEDIDVTTEYFYNLCGLPETTKVTAFDIPVAIISTAQYDTEKRFVIKQTNAKGHVSETTYDAAYGNVLTKKDPNGLVTAYTYDGFGRLSTTTPPSPTPAITVTREWAIGSNCQMYLITTSQPGMPTTKQYYDKLSREIRSETIGFDGSAIFATKTFNTLGQLIQETEPNNTSLFTGYVYEPDFKRLQKVTSPSGTTIEYAYSGNATTITTTAGPSIRTVTKTTDASGTLINSTDIGGTLTYLYHSCGKARSITAPGSSAVTMEYDAYGRQKKLTDPDAGIITYDYNKLGQLIKQQTAKQKAVNSTYSTTITYDVLGRVETKVDPQEGTTTYIYDTQPNGKGLLASTTHTNGINSNYTYDNLSRLFSKTDQNITIGGVTSNYSKAYLYDNLNRVQEEFYPGGFSVKSVYNNYGYLDKLTNGDGSLVIWQCNDMNERGQVKKYTYGNGMVTEKTYTNLGYLSNTQLKDGAIVKWNMSSNFDPLTGNLSNRIDNTRALSETFAYDNLDRLETVTKSGVVNVATDYLPSGNINSKSDAGTYAYTGIGPHAVSAINNLTGAMPTDQQDITYTAFNKASAVTEGSNVLTFIYGYDQQRRTSKLTTSGVTQREIAYLGNYEKIKQGSTTYEVHYVNSPAGLTAMYVTQNGIGSMYYVNTDHLGSIAILYDQSKVKTAEQSFDAWGRERNPNDWTYTPNSILPTPNWLLRGYTGHEHHKEFGLVNMNGRMYDPLVGRMLSPDNYVQAAGSSQSYNRYSYVWNNPLRYTDPTGDLVFVMPNVSWSRSGGLDLGVTVGVGVPGVLSAQLSVGYGFRSHNAYASVGGTAGGVTASVGYGTQTGFTAGIGFGYGLGLPGIGTNMTSAGMSYSQNGGASANMFGFQFNDAVGASFDPSFSVSKAFSFQKKTTPSPTPIQNTDPDLYASTDAGPDAMLAKKEFPSFATLWDNYPDANADGSPAHPTVDPYSNQCAIRVGVSLQLSGVDMSSYPEVNLTTDGYPRSADNLANWLWKNYGSPKIMQSRTFETNHVNSTGIIYIEGIHIDLWNKGQTGSGFYSGNVMFWPIK